MRPNGVCASVGSCVSAVFLVLGVLSLTTFTAMDERAYESRFALARFSVGEVQCFRRETVWTPVNSTGARARGLRRVAGRGNPDCNLYRLQYVVSYWDVADQTRSQGLFLPGNEFSLLEDCQTIAYMHRDTVREVDGVVDTECIDNHWDQLCFHPVIPMYNPKLWSLSVVFFVLAAVGSFVTCLMLREPLSAHAAAAAAASDAPAPAQ